MPEITKSGAKLHLFIVTHKYTDLYFIFSFNNQPQVGKPTWGYNYTTVLRRLPHPSSAITHRIAHPHRPPSSSDCANGAIHRHRRKTAEERFNMLARGWLAYPVTPTHHQSTAEERLYKRHPSVCTLSSQSDGTLRNPVRKAQRSVPGFSSTPTSACRRYATSPPSAVASPHRPPSIGLRIHIVRHHHRIAPTAQYTAIGEKTAEERFHTLARGWLAYPVTPTHHPIGLPRPVTPCAIRRERSLRFPEAPLFALINYCFLTA